MDSIAYYPSSVAFVMVFAVPYAIVIALTRTALLKYVVHGPGPDRMAPAGKGAESVRRVSHHRWGTRRR